MPYRMVDKKRDDLIHGRQDTHCARPSPPDMHFGADGVFTLQESDGSTRLGVYKQRSFPYSPVEVLRREAGQEHFRARRSNVNFLSQ